MNSVLRFWIFNYMYFA